MNLKRKILDSIFAICLAIIALASVWSLVDFSRACFYKKTENQIEEFEQNRVPAERELVRFFQQILRDLSAGTLPPEIENSAKFSQIFQPKSGEFLERNFACGNANSLDFREQFEKFRQEIFVRERFRGNENRDEFFHPLVLAFQQKIGENQQISHELFLVRRERDFDEIFSIFWLDLDVFLQEISRHLQREISPTICVKFAFPQTTFFVDENGEIWQKYQPWREENFVNLGGLRVRLENQFYVARETPSVAPKLLRAGTLAALGIAIFAAIWLLHRRETRRRLRLIDALAHELRAPLARERVFLETILANEWNAERAENAWNRWQILREHSRKTAEKIEEIFAQKSENLAISRERILLEKFVEIAIFRARERLNEAGISLEIAMAESLREREIASEPEIVGQILFNLADNVARHANVAGTPVKLEIFERRGNVNLRFCDGGNGFLARPRERDFGRGQGDFNRNMGIGLELSKMLARAIDCRLKLERTDATGTSFLLRI